MTFRLDLNKKKESLEIFNEAHRCSKLQPKIDIQIQYSHSTTSKANNTFNSIENTNEMFYILADNL